MLFCLMPLSLLLPAADVGSRLIYFYAFDTRHAMIALFRH